jgi:hypothetical protein
MISPLIAAEFGRKQQEGGTESLAAPVDQLLRYLSEAGDLGDKLEVKFLLNPLHICSDQIDKLIHEILVSLGLYTRPPFSLSKAFSALFEGFMQGKRILEHRQNRWYNYGALGKGLIIVELVPPIFCYGGIAAIGPEKSCGDSKK